MNQNIDFQVCGIANVLKNYRLRVPLNQREYSWTNEQVTDLLQDLTKAIQTREQAYFLGTIVLTKGKNSDEFDVADGQQRLATASIILAHFRDLFCSFNDSVAVESLEHDFLSTIDIDAREVVPKITLNADDNEFFINTIIRQLGKRKDIRPSRTSHRLICEAQSIICRHFQTAAEQVGPNNFPAHLLEWRRYLQDQANVVVLKVNDAANAFVMFETLNDRGLKTSQADLVKNLLFQRADDRLSEAQTHWSQMRGAVESVGEPDLIMEYLRLTSCLLNGPTRQKDVLDKMAAQARSKSEALMLLQFLDELANDYAAILNPDHSKWNSYLPFVRDCIRTINIIGVTQVRPLMLSIARHFDQPNTASAFRLMVSWSVRFLVEGERGGKLDDGYARFANEIHVRKIKTSIDLYNAAKTFVPSDAQFKDTFTRSRVGTAKLARYYLRSLELTMQNNKEPEFIPNQDSAINLEHVMPQRESPDWPHVTPQDIETHASRLGNMVLLQATKNNQLGSKAFDVKKRIFKDSPYILTAQIADKTSWGTKEIEERQNILAEYAAKTWPIDLR
jgi:hypothetical protein